MKFSNTLLSLFSIAPSVLASVAPPTTTLILRDIQAIPDARAPSFTPPASSSFHYTTTPPTPTSSLIRLGFNHLMNFKHITRTPVAGSQVIQFLPQAVAYGLEISEEDVKVNNIQGWNRGKLGYEATVVYLYVPGAKVEALVEMVKEGGRLYEHSDPLVRQLAGLLDKEVAVVGELPVEA